MKAGVHYIMIILNEIVYLLFNISINYTFPLTISRI